MGRHQHLPSVPTPRDLTNSEPQSKASKPEPKSWNPFKRKK